MRTAAPPSTRAPPSWRPTRSCATAVESSTPRNGRAPCRSRLREAAFSRNLFSRADRGNARRLEQGRIMKILFSLCLLLGLVSIVHAAPGDLDTSFSTDGKVVTDVPG